MSDVMRLKRDDPDFGLADGDLLLTVPADYDPDKVIVVCRLFDGFDPECSQYRTSIERVSDDELCNARFEWSK